MDWKYSEKDQKSFVLFLKYLRKVFADMQNFYELDEVHFIVNLYNFILP